MAEPVLAGAPHPVLVLGPHTRAVGGAPTALVVLIDRRSALGPLAGAVGAFGGVMAGVPLVVAELAPPDPWRHHDDDPALDPIRSFAAELGAAERVVVTDTDPHAALRRAADLVPGAVVAVAARRWPDPGERWYGRARRLIRTVRAPILVVPDDLAPAVERPGRGSAGGGHLAPR